MSVKQTTNFRQLILNSFQYTVDRIPLTLNIRQELDTLTKGHHSPCCVSPHRGNYQEMMDPPFIPNPDNLQTCPRHMVNNHNPPPPSHLSPPLSSPPLQTFQLLWQGKCLLLVLISPFPPRLHVSAVYSSLLLFVPSKCSSQSVKFS